MRRDPRPGFDPVLWGRASWTVLYEAAMHRPALARLLILFYALILPCSLCQIFTAYYVRKYGVETFDDAFEEVYALHATVTAKRRAGGHASLIPSLAHMRRRYEMGSDVSDAAIAQFLTMIALMDPDRVLYLKFVRRVAAALPSRPRLREAVRRAWSAGRHRRHPRNLAYAIYAHVARRPMTTASRDEVLRDLDTKGRGPPRAPTTASTPATVRPGMAVKAVPGR